MLDNGVPWTWTASHDLALQAIKDCISSNDVLAHYTPDAELFLTCDASPYGVGAVLARTVIKKNRKTEAPISFASRTLTETERRYSQLDKEALAIRYGVTKFSQYLIGRTFTIVTDHRPLLGIFTPGKPIPDHLSPRLVRYVLHLAGMRYKLVYRPGNSIGHADYLSRHPVEAATKPQDPDPAGIHLLESNDLGGLTPRDIAAATAEDPVLRRVREWTVKGWPPSVPDEYSPYFHKQTELSTLQECLLWRDRVVIPTRLRSRVLQLIHGTHLGESYSKATARAIVWWPGVDSDVVDTVKTCDLCQKTAKAPPRGIVSPWPRAESAWERVHLDYFGPLQGHHFLLAVDSYSGWPIVRPVSSLSASVLIQHVRYIMADYGKPVVFVTDNGAQFASEEFRAFLRKNGVRHLFSPPWHPASNGQAERSVGTYKTFFKRFPAGDIHERNARTLWAMRTAPSSLDGRTPAELMGRPFRTHLTQLHPSQEPVRTSPTCAPARRPGELVLVLRHSLNKTEWLPGVVTASSGSRCFDVRLESGQVMKNVSADHLRLRFGEESSVPTPKRKTYLDSFQASVAPVTRSARGQAEGPAHNALRDAEERQSSSENSNSPPEPVPTASEQPVPATADDSTPASPHREPPTTETIDSSVRTHERRESWRPGDKQYNSIVSF